MDAVGRSDRQSEFASASRYAREARGDKYDSRVPANLRQHMASPSHELPTGDDELKYDENGVPSFPLGHSASSPPSSMEAATDSIADERPQSRPIEVRRSLSLILQESH